jgi:hypothetical protein
MNELNFDDPCLVFTLRQEARAFLREFRPQQRFPSAPCPARFCGPSWLTVLVLETGTGKEHTEAAFEWVFRQPQFGNVPYRPKLLISAGFCTALEEQFQVGDVILASEVVDGEGRVWPVPWPAELPPGEWRPPLHRGRLAAVARVLGTPEERRAEGQRQGAVAADPVSATVARYCKQHDVPFACVRAVCDDLDSALSPRLVTMLAGGGPSPMQSLVAAATSPSVARDLWRRAGQRQRAAEQLGKALGELLTLTLPFSVD